MDGNVDNHWLEENIHHGFEFFEPMANILLEDSQMAIPDQSEKWYYDGRYHKLLETRMCMSGVLESLLPLMMWSMGLSVVQRLIWRTDLYVYFLMREHLRDCLVSALGLFLLWSNASIYQPYAFVIYFWISATALFLLNRSPNKGHYVSLITFVYVVLTQIYFEDVQFTAFRGSLMIVSMKMISLAYDTKEISMVDMPSIMAYIFNPSTLLFGPFNTIEQYRHAKRRCQKFCVKSFLLHFITCLKYLAFAIIFVTYSSCIVDQIPTFFNEPKIGLYTTAQAFRSSQYFVGYFSLFTALIGGFGDSDVHTTHWTSVEWPRSLTEVVVHWNLPMHGFLHKYVFQKTKQNFGHLPAMLLTFLASSLLHLAPGPNPSSGLLC
ncbi:MBOAT, membrane-bound o-acyltransferase family domain-containing protein [Ditylenchus destructor]|nr:MBOAT, membrane-bound o-acyltransferase family domain-containing protein [Ditylenchus destructor]